jgi:hypothetical protein
MKGESKEALMAGIAIGFWVDDDDPVLISWAGVEGIGSCF